MSLMQFAGVCSPEQVAYSNQKLSLVIQIHDLEVDK